jgi:hypothetical protein
MLMNAVTTNGIMCFQDGDLIKNERESFTTLRGHYFSFAKPSQPPYTFSLFPILNRKTTDYLTCTQSLPLHCFCRRFMIFAGCSNSTYSAVASVRATNLATHPPVIIHPSPCN